MTKTGMFNITRGKPQEAAARPQTKDVRAVPSNYKLIACHAGKTEPVHEKTIKRCFDQYRSRSRAVHILISGIAYISPYNVNSILNPILVQDGRRLLL